MYLFTGSSKTGAVNCNAKSTSWATKIYIKLKYIVIENRQKKLLPDYTVILPEYGF